MQDRKDSAVKAEKGSKKSDKPKELEMIELAGVKKERKETAQQISGLKEHVTALQGGIEERDGEIGKITKNLESATKKLGEARGKNDSMASRMAQLEKTVAGGDAEARMKQRDVLKADVVKVQKEKREIEKASKAKDEQISELKKALDRITRKLDAVEPTIQSMQNARSGAQKREKDALGQLGKLTAERNEALDKAKGLKAEITQLKEKATRPAKAAAQPAR